MIWTKAKIAFLLRKKKMFRKYEEEEEIVRYLWDYRDWPDSLTRERRESVSSVGFFSIEPEPSVHKSYVSQWARDDSHAT